MTMKLLIGFTLISAAGALCIGDSSPCNGHGTCEANDKCNCFANWQGVDCGERTCPYDISFNEVSADSASSVVGHKYSECSSKGSCDRKTGECKCFDGYDGRACTRMKCDNDCSGHGTCQTIGTTSTAYAGWDKTKIQSCTCDPGWEGIDCSARKCPKGDDPVSTHTGGTAQDHEIQTITISGTRNSGEKFTLSYTDFRGETWKTHPIDAVAPTVIEVKQALEALPNNAIPSVTVTLDTTCASGSNCVFTVNFDHAANSGDQPMLVKDTTGCDTDGCQPRFVGGSGSVVVAESQKGTTEFAVCSNRGTCDVQTGKCECAQGYAGQRCEEQTTHR